jgi:hypothetical protein
VLHQALRRTFQTIETELEIFVFLFDGFHDGGFFQYRAEKILVHIVNA